MPGKNFFISLLNRLKSSDWLTPVSKKLPGEWILFEYYTESADELIHVNTLGMREKQTFWTLKLSDNQLYIHHSNLTVPLVSTITSGTWSRSRNFLSIIHPEESGKTVKFQFALEKGTLKLLKKSSEGKIEFFGFFHQPTVGKQD